MKKIIASITAFLLSFTIAHAAVGITTNAGSVSNVNDLAFQLKGYFDTAIQLMLAAGVVWVIWSAFKFVMSAGDEEKRKEGREGIIYGIIGLAIMLSVWGLVGLVTRSTGLSGTGAGLTAPSVTGN
ncbi:MAG: hypothetical protein HZB12_02325 [Candidatus Yonathbacteria bacterium]|nr:hypothetical protein [Candidatus Yonathbacteria bacterium]